MNAEDEKMVADFVRERNEALITLDVDKVIAFHNKWNPDSQLNISRENSEIGMHKAITAVSNLPREIRMNSKRWLSERGYKSLDEGKINDS